MQNPSLPVWVSSYVSVEGGGVLLLPLHLQWYVAVYVAVYELVISRQKDRQHWGLCACKEEAKTAHLPQTPVISPLGRDLHQTIFGSWHTWETACTWAQHLSN